MTIKEAQELLGRVVHDGAFCPVCEQHAKVYHRKLNHQSVRVLATMWRVYGRDWCHMSSLMKRFLPDIAHQGGHATIAAYWNLIEEEKQRREDGGRAGWWRLTDRGVAWLKGEIKVAKYAETYNSNCLGYSGELVSVEDALGEKGFNLAELMSGI